MVDGHATGLAGDRDRLVNLKIRIGRIHGAAENVVSAVVVQNRSLVRTRNDLQRAIFLSDIFQKDAEGQHVVIGVGIEGPVLMPLDGSTATRSLCIQFGCLQYRVWANELPQNLGDP